MLGPQARSSFIGNFKTKHTFICIPINRVAMDKRLICDFMNIDLLCGDAKYLGLPSFWGRSKAEAYTFFGGEIAQENARMEVKEA